MKKNQTRLKNIIAFLLPLMWLCFAFWGFSSIEFADSHNTEQIVFKADHVELVNSVSIGRFSRQRNSIILHCDVDKYKYGVKYFSQYSGNDLIDKLSSEELSIVYLTSNNVIVDIKSTETVFYTIENYNAEQTVQLVVGIVLFAIFQIIFLLFSFFYFLVNGGKITRWFHRKKKTSKQF